MMAIRASTPACCRCCAPITGRRLLAPVGSWIDTPLNQPVDFAGTPRPRSDFLTWEQIREVSQSGLVEIAAHTDANHKGMLANPQGNLQPAAATRRYDPATGRYETEAEFQARLRADVAAISEKIRKVTGNKPRVWVWPYGAADGTSLASGRRAGLPDGPDPGRRPRQPSTT